MITAALPINRVEVTMPQFAGLRNVVDQYRERKITCEYYLYACKSICPALKEWQHNELVVVSAWESKP